MRKFGVRRSSWLLFFLAFLLALPQGVLAAPAGASMPQQDDGPNLRVTAAGQEETVLELTTPVYRLETVQGVDGPCERILVEGFPQDGAPGAPQLPVKTAVLGLPPAATVTLQAVPLETETLPGVHRLCPAPAPTRVEGEDGVAGYVEQDVALDPTAYGQNRLYPEQAAVYAELGYMRSQRLGKVQFAPFQYNPVTGQILFHKRLQVRVQHPGGLVLRGRPVQEPASVEETLRNTLLNYDAARAWRSEAPIAAADASWTPPTPSWRLHVKQEGVYVVTYEELAQAGVPLYQVDPQTIRLLHDGKEVAIRVVNEAGEDDFDGSFDPGDEIRFYGQGVDEKYTDTNIYWLTYGGASGLRMVRKAGGPNGTQVSSYPATEHVEDNQNYVSTTPRDADYNHWYGRLLTAVGKNGQDEKTELVNLSALASGTYSATLRVALAGRTRGLHHVLLSVNGQQVLDSQWKDTGYYTFTAQFDQALLQEGANRVSIALVNDLGIQTVSVAYIDWVEIIYRRQFVAQADQLIFDGPGGGLMRYMVTGFSSGDLEAYDVTDPYRVSHLDVEAVAGLGSFTALEQTPRRYLMQRISKRLSVDKITRAMPQNLRAGDLGADLIVISHPDFLGAIQPLVDYRIRQGYRVQLVNLLDIYDQFNYGRVSVHAIRAFLAYAYANWQPPAPAYVLLVGDGTYDPRNYRGDSNPTFIPPYLEVVDLDLGETAADNRYVTIVGDDNMPDMSLGRFPVETPAQVTAMVEKTIAYETVAIEDGWNRNVLFVADDLKGGGGSFYNFSNAVADGTVERGGVEKPILPTSYTKTKLYLGQDCLSGEECRQRIIDRINQGVMLVSYVGHSAKQSWAEEQILNLSALSQLRNQGRYPIMVPMTCLEGYYHEAAKNNATLAESGVRMANAGPVASWSATGLGLVTGHDYLEKGFFLALFHDGWRTVGDATTQGKLYLIQNAPIGRYRDLLDTFVLLGDPTLKVRTLETAAVTNPTKVYLPTVLQRP